VIGSDSEFVELSHYDTSHRLTNCYFVYDAFPSRRTNVDRAIAGLRLVMPLQALPFDRMRTAHSEFVLIGDASDPVIQRSLAEGADISFHQDPGSGLNYWAVRLPR
jgi:hypothetical protein